MINVLVADLEELRWSAPAQLERTGSGAVAVDGRDDLAACRRARELAVAELRLVVPPGHSFGRRGR